MIVRSPDTRERIVEYRIPHVAAAICQGRLGQLIMENGMSDPYYSERDRRRAHSVLPNIEEPTKRDLKLAAQALTAKEAASRDPDGRSASAIGTRRAFLQSRLGAASATHLVRTAIEHRVVPFDRVDMHEPPTAIETEPLLALGLVSHGVRNVSVTRTIGGLTAETYLKRAAAGVFTGEAVADERDGFARTPLMVYTAFQEGWFQPEADGVLRPNAVKEGVRQLFHPTHDFVPINLAMAAV